MGNQVAGLVVPEPQKEIPSARSSRSTSPSSDGGGSREGVAERLQELALVDTSISPSACTMSSDSLPTVTYIDIPVACRDEMCLKSVRRSSFSHRECKVLPMRLDLEKLQYTVRRGRGPSKTILDDISLTILPGQLLAIMGPSGSGKTTLLRALHGDRQVMNRVKGNIYANGTPVRNIQTAFRQLCSLVPQQDVLLPCFTVHQTLMYTAMLRLPQHWSRNEKALIVDSVMSELGLVGCKDVHVGCVEKKGISGGQRHRLSIGQELLVDPSVLLLDEPTSGLDSTTAEDLCSLLSSLSQPGRCVVCTIHQPSARIFMGFDRVCFMVNGRLSYDGPVSRVSSFFSSLGFELPSYENPADYYMRVLCQEPKKLLDGWHSYAFDKFPDGEGLHVADSVQKLDVGGSWLASKDLEGTSSCWQFWVLFARMMSDSLRDPGRFLSGVIMECIAGLLVGLVWFQVPIYSQKSIVPMCGVFVMLTTISVFDSTMGVSLKFPTTRALHFREYANGYYHLLPYYLASVTSSCLLIATYQSLQAAMVYFMVGLEFSWGTFLPFVLVLVLAACIGGSIGFLLGVFTSDIQRIQQIITPFTLPMIIFSGYMLPLPSIPSYLRWLYHVSVFQYIYTTLLRLHFKGLVFEDCQAVGMWCYKTGDEFLRSVEVDPDGTPHAIGMLALLLTSVCFVSFLVLRWKSR